MCSRTTCWITWISVFTIFVFCAYNADAYTIYNRYHTPKPRIIGGEPVHPQLIPYIVRITMNYPSINMSGTCGGTLISEKHVLTAGHCFLFGGEVHKIEFGAHKNQNVEEFKSVKFGGSYVKHPGENIDLNSHDIAIITLTSPVEIDSHYVNIAKLPEKEEANNTFLGKIVQAYGWGMSSDEPPEEPRELMGVSLIVIDFDTCYDQLKKAMYPEVPHLYDYEICTSGRSVDSSRPAGICHGDSGGPLIYNGTLIGVTSRSANWFCSHGNPDVFVSVGQHLDWIKEQLNML